MKIISPINYFQIKPLSISFKYFKQSDIEPFIFKIDHKRRYSHDILIDIKIKKVDTI